MREEGRRRVSVNPSRRVVVMQSLWARACYAIKRFFHDKSITKAMFVLLAVDVLLVVTELLMDTQAECVVSSVACRGRDEAASCHSGLGPVMHPDPHAHRGAHGGGHGGQEEMVFSHHVQTLDGGEGVCPAGPLTVEMKLRLFHFLHVWHTPVHLLSIIICGVLLTECALIMLVEGPSHWRNPLYAADFLVLTFSLVIDVFFSHGAEGLQLLFVRVQRGGRGGAGRGEEGGGPVPAGAGCSEGTAAQGPRPERPVGTGTARTEAGDQPAGAQRRGGPFELRFRWKPGGRALPHDLLEHHWTRFPRWVYPPYHILTFLPHRHPREGSPRGLGAANACSGLHAPFLALFRPVPSCGLSLPLLQQFPDQRSAPSSVHITSHSHMSLADGNGEPPACPQQQRSHTANRLSGNFYAFATTLK
eukprot:GGOE01003685.1.p1 GENE.GGOE01003685.1~~GGOE01003685.1.p1  ORF type:complete len:417 (+),score=52.12 GGOE01003685.1:137-1387(+)